MREEEEQLFHTCTCVVLIDGRQVSVLRTIPYELELIGLGHTIVSGYKPESVYVFQSSVDEYVVNTLTMGRYEHPSRELVQPRIRCDLVVNTCKKLLESLRETNLKLHRALVITAEGKYVCDVEDLHTTSLLYRLVGAVYKLRAMLEDLVVFLTCPVDKTVLSTLVALRLIGIVTLSEVTYDAVRYAEENNVLLIGNVSSDGEEFSLYVGEVY